MILNLTQHAPTPEQVEAGVGQPLLGIAELLTFNSLPTATDIHNRAWDIAQLAREYCDEGRTAMIGGAPFLMKALEEHLRYAKIQPLYAFSVRESVETVKADGSVSKTAVFRHVGFIAA